MLHSLKLLLPALIPSWRFFDGIAPSPRIEFATLATAHATPVWQEFRPRPQHLPLSNMLARLFWNPRWNEQLFLVSCAERLNDEPTDHSRDEIFTRIQNELMRTGALGPHLQFRLIFVSRKNTEITYISPVRRCFA